MTITALHEIEDTELARRSMRGMGEMLAALGRGSAGPEAEVRRPDALGARIAVASDNPWFDAVVVPAGAVPPADDPRFPLCVWTFAGAVPGRVEDATIATPCMGVALGDAHLLALGRGAGKVETPDARVLGEMNERAYGDPGMFGPLVSAVRDERVRFHGLRNGAAFVCVAMTMAVDDDLGIYFVATEESHRRRGLASQLLLAIMTQAREAGMRSATLQASADGLSVYKRLGFRRIGTMRGYLRPA